MLPSSGYMAPAWLGMSLLPLFAEKVPGQLSANTSLQPPGSGGRGVVQLGTQPGAVGLGRPDSPSWAPPAV